MFSRFNRKSRKPSIAVLLLVAIALGISIASPLASFADLPGGCDFSPANNGIPNCQTPLTGSTFAGGDGNLATSPTNFGTTDWQNVAGLNPGFDLPSGSNDNSFGQGTKEDNPVVSVVTGSIPPNKSNLTRFYESSETGSNGDKFLYLAWERTNVLGTANFDFEINQATQPDLTTPGTKTLNRMPGDLLVTYDFTNGGGRPTIGLLRWLTSASVPIVPNFATNVCFSSNTFPCWGDHVTLTSGDSIAAVNNLDAVNDPLFPNAANYINPLPALQFGETAIDLTTAGVFPPGTCTAFGSAFVRSRSSASFTAEVKDFIAPIPVTISNCGEIKIIKQTDPRGQNQVFSFTSASLPLPASPTAGGVTCPGNNGAGVQPDGSFCLNDTGNGGKAQGSILPTDNSTGNTVDVVNVPQGTYTVSEGAAPNGFTFESLTCTTDAGSGSTATTSSQTATINLKPAGLVTCLYVNQLDTAVLQTQVSNAGPVFPGSTAIHDVLTVTGNQPTDTPSGSVTFFLCGPLPTGACVTGGLQLVPSSSLSGSANVATATSPDVNTAANPLAAGRYCFRAEWPGDIHYVGARTEYGGTDGTNECFNVQQIPTTTTTTPSAGSGGSVNFNSSVTDHAIVTASQSGDGNPTGTVTFFLCDPTQTVGGACSAPAGTQIGAPVDLQAINPSDPPASFADSIGATVNKTGVWCWRSVFTPGGANALDYTGSVDDGDTHECFSVTDTTSSTSAQTWLPNDTATVAPANGAPLNGTLSAQLYTGGTCGVGGGTAVGGQLYQKTLTNATSAADRTLTTNNATYMVTADASVSWLITFASGDPFVASGTHCESTSLTIIN